jgi:hypothetical protein
LRMSDVVYSRTAYTATAYTRYFSVDRMSFQGRTAPKQPGKGVSC